MPQIHPTAIVAPEADLAEDVTVGPFTVIEGPVKLASGVRVEGHARICGHTEIGESAQIGWGTIIGADPQDLSFDPLRISGVKIGPRNVIREYVTIHRGSREGGYTSMGADNFIMTGVHLAHDVILGSNNVLANNVLLGGHIHVGDRTFLGGSAVFHQFIRIGDLAMVQGASALSGDVPPYCMAHGHNIISGLNVIGMRRAGLDAGARAEVKRAYKLIYLSGRGRAEIVAEAEHQEWTPEARRFFKAFIDHSRKGVLSPAVDRTRRAMSDSVPFLTDVPPSA